MQPIKAFLISQITLLFPPKKLVFPVIKQIFTFSAEYLLIKQYDEYTCSHRANSVACLCNVMIMMR